MTSYLIYEASKVRSADLRRAAELQRLARANAPTGRPLRHSLPGSHRRALRRPRAA